MSANKPEQAVSYAALILADESIAITAEKLQALIKAAGIEDVEPIWATIFANALKDKDVKDILTTVTAAPAVRGTAADSKEDGKGGDAAEAGEDEIVSVDVDGDSDDGSAFGDLFG
jgi:large subunit ribosomal protein LP1